MLGRADGLIAFGETARGVLETRDPRPTHVRTIPPGVDTQRFMPDLAARRRIVQRIGLPAVRAHRLAELDQEERTWREQLQRLADAQPEMVPLLLVAVKGGQ